MTVPVSKTVDQMKEGARILKERREAELNRLYGLIDQLVEDREHIPGVAREVLERIRELKVRDEGLQYLIRFPTMRKMILSELIGTPREWWQGNLAFMPAQLAFKPADIVELIKAALLLDQTDHPLYVHLEETLEERFLFSSREEYKDCWLAILGFFEDWQIARHHEKVPLLRLVRELFDAMVKDKLIESIPEGEYRFIVKNATFYRGGEHVTQERPGWHFACALAPLNHLPGQLDNFCFHKEGEMILHLSNYFAGGPIPARSKLVQAS